MCGIAGMLSFEGGPGELPGVQAMCHALTHRGPDDEGFYVGAHAAIGMRRLSVIDVACGHQPVSNEDGTVWVVLNGEIYNFRELRRDLEARGHQFRTHTDTEVIVHLYETYGADCVTRLRGMFAFAVWDVRRRSLLVARDRLGIKPLYYAVRGPRLYFASELKALLQVPEIERHLSWPAVGHLFTFLSTSQTDSVISGVKKLPPGHVMMAAPRRALTLRRYWDVQFAPDHALTEGDAVERVRELVDDAVREHMVSDVPIGAFLSGGIDSSAVVASMARHANGPVRTFSIGFSEAGFDELPAARQVARTFGTEHHELVLEPDVMGVLDDLVWHLDEPFGDSSAIPTYMVSRLAAQHVTVALSGDGGDELFAGYDRYVVEQRERRRERMPRALRQLAARIGDGLPEGARGRNFLRHLGMEGWARYADAAVLFKREQLGALLRPDVAEAVRRHDPQSRLTAELAGTGGHWLSTLQRADLTRYLPLDILTKVDRMSMAHSLEARVPLLDHRLVEFAATIPPELLLKDGQTKYVFKQALRGRVPDDILQRPKQGFAVPLDRWFRGQLSTMVRDLLLSGRGVERGVFDPAYVRKLVRMHEGGRPLGLQLWTLLSFELWCRQFLDRPPAPSRTYRSPRHLQLDAAVGRASIGGAA